MIEKHFFYSWQGEAPVFDKLASLGEFYGLLGI